MYDAVVCVDHVVCLYVFVHVVDWSGYSANAFLVVAYLESCHMVVARLCYRL